jgi:hypothetical protein
MCPSIGHGQLLCWLSRLVPFISRGARTQKVVFEMAKKAKVLEAGSTRGLYLPTAEEQPGQSVGLYCASYVPLSFSTLADISPIAPCTNAGSSRFIARYFFNNSRGGALNPFFSNVI